MYFMFLMLFQRDKNKHNHNDLERDIKRPCDLDKKSVQVSQIKQKKRNKKQAPISAFQVTCCWFNPLPLQNTLRSKRRHDMKPRQEWDGGRWMKSTLFSIYFFSFTLLAWANPWADPCCASSVSLTQQVSDVKEDTPRAPWQADVVLLSFWESIFLSPKIWM